MAETGLSPTKSDFSSPSKTQTNFAPSYDIESLLQKVSMNKAFLQLAEEDAGLIKEMKKAVTELYGQAKIREMIYLAVEHNCKYLSALA